ncbi:MAG: hypothetical protein AAGF12_30345 [Myxococcota bacterium]
MRWVLKGCGHGALMCAVFGVSGVVAAQNSPEASETAPAEGASTTTATETAPAESVDAESYAQRLRALSADVAAVRADAFTSYARLRSLWDQLYEDRSFARATITQEDRTGALFDLVSVEYALDGVVIFQRSFEPGTAPEELAIYDGGIAPGSHTLTVLLRYLGDGLPYMSGYRTTVRSRHTVEAAGQRRLELRVRPYAAGGPTESFEDRVRVVFQERLE